MPTRLQEFWIFFIDWFERLKKKKMTEQDKFKIVCFNCKNETIHRISKLSRKKGAKIQCQDCLKEKPKWWHIKFLETFRWQE